MQRFIKGYKTEETSLSPLPFIIGMSATSERFNNLAGTLENATLRPVLMPPKDVVDSGLLKDKIVIVYPETEKGDDDMTLLEAAAVAWKDKTEYWW